MLLLGCSVCRGVVCFVLLLLCVCALVRVGCGVVFVVALCCVVVLRCVACCCVGVVCVWCVS